jgi:hypothetical protein
MIEKIYYSDTEYVTFNIPDEGAIGCFMSGGADSSLMCYLLAKTIVKHNLKTKVFPITGEMLRRPYNLRHASDVVERVTELTGFKFDLHLCFIVPNHKAALSDDEKVEIQSTYTRAYGLKFQLSTIFNGLTANPPEGFVIDSEYGERQKCRDDLKWRQEQEAKMGLSVPFIHVDKRSLAELYKKFDLLDRLLPLTRSCEAELLETEYFTKVCQQARPQAQACWWCRERAYGFDHLLG